ncbi:hypothetical protein SAMN04487775_11063 [Treponema bryantii]|uniref:Uncharacterized protein n=1 Tax=Treponema bryantii TaxID=163 RepID=A0A1I3MRN7_9SPIR|nr:hypothetical protein [Treponema bryantii]SFI99601.1 hypothetical protein SAMN04487775_11063 [Treponema bryantii]
MKKIAGAIISIGLILALSGCHWEIPETISVKSDAEYNFSLGTFEKELDNDMSLSSMTGDAGKDKEGINTYDYFPGKLDKNTQHFLMEVEAMKLTIFTKAQIETLLTTLATQESFEVGTDIPFTLSGNDHGSTDLDFNPSSMLSGMKDAFGSDMSGKISFASVPMYLYSETAEGLTAEVKLKMYYAYDSNGSGTMAQRGTSETYILGSDSGYDSITNTPKPAYAKEESTIITNLAQTNYISLIPMEELINAEGIEEDDKLYVDYEIHSLTGSVSRAYLESLVAADKDLELKLFTLIDIPVKFKVSDTEDLKLDLSEMTKSDGSSGSDPSTPSSGDESSKSSDFEKYLQIIDTLKVKYIAYKLPFYATSGMKLGIDLVGDGNFEYSSLSVVDKNKTITEDDKGLITLPYTTVQKLKDTSSFTPNIQILMSKSSVFSIPREKAIEMNIELSLKTDGVVQVK